MKAFFITGTDTGVGKTLVGGAMARALVETGRRVGVMKPFEAGCAVSGDRLVPADAVFLKAMAGSRDPLETVCPYPLKQPLAPYVAAAIDKVTISIDTIQSILAGMRRRCDVVLVEGAGGLMVPLAENVLTCDLVAALNLPLIIVARLSLGTINHTLLTIQHARRCGLGIAGVVFSRSTPASGTAEETNPEVIRLFSGTAVLGTMAFIPEEYRNDGGYLARKAAGCIDFSLLGL